MRIVRALLLKEYLHILRDPRSLIAAFAIPLVLILLFGYAISFDVKRVDIAVQDQDRSPESRELLAHLFASGVLLRVAEIDQRADIDSMLVRAQAGVVVVIPPGYSKAIGRGETATVQAIADGSSGSFAALALSYVLGTVAQIGARLATDRLAAAGVPELASEVPPLQARTRMWFNEALESHWFTIPGLLAIVVMMLAAQITSQCVAREFEKGTIEPLIASPMRGWQLVAGKLIPYVSIGVGQVFTVTLLSRFWFGVPFRGSVLIFCAGAAFFLIGSMAIGLLLSIVTRSQQLAQQAALLVTMLPSLILSGFIFPLPNMPPVLRGISYIVPARYFLEIVRGVMLRGASAGDVARPLIFMALYSAIVTTLCIALFRKRLA
ncbi:MAG TPA: ABC transporter permease [bacterium]|nr:ABC transporter permease [bacterium]